jgi:hypothetical protein
MEASVRKDRGYCPTNPWARLKTPEWQQFWERRGRRPDLPPAILVLRPPRQCETGAVIMSHVDVNDADVDLWYLWMEKISQTIICTQSSEAHCHTRQSYGLSL